MSTKPMKRAQLLGLVVLSWIWISTQAIRADLNTAASLESLIDASAAKMGQRLRSAGISELAVRIEGTFEDALRNKILNSIRSSFLDQNIEISKTNRSAKYLIAAVSNSLPQDATGGSPSYKIQFSLVDQNNKPSGVDLNDLDVQQNNSEEIVRELAIPVENSDRSTGQSSPVEAGVVDAVVVGYLDPDSTKKLLPDPAEKSASPGIRRTVKRPTLGLPTLQEIADEIVYAQKNGMFGIQILSKGKPVRHLIYNDGLAMVEFKDEEYYEVLLKNHANFDVLVNLQIDGVDSGFFSKTRRLLWFVPAGKSIVVEGWKKDGNETAARFAIVNKEDSVAAKNGLSMNVGTISASYYKAFDNEEQRDQDADEAKAFRQRQMAGTGEGPEFQFKTRNVNKIPGALRASVSVRYDRTRQ